MKRFLALSFLTGLCICVFSRTAAANENHKNEIYFTAGTPSLIGIFTGAFASLGDKIDDKEDSGYTLTSGYNHFFLNHFGLGAFVSYEQFGSLKLFSVQPKLTLQYGFKHFKLYHSASAGILTSPGNGSSKAFDFTYLGVKLDFSRFNVFAEGSLPTTGILKAGISYKF